MCRLLGWVADEPITAREAIGDEGLAALLWLASLHSDGWGIAYDDGDGLETERSTERADTDPAFTRAVTTRATRVGIVHLRWATPGLPVQLANTHPFRRGSDTFAHNGAIYPVDRLDTMLSRSGLAELGGTTDSEHYFLAIETALDEPRTSLDAAVSKVTGRLFRDFEPSSLNALIATPKALGAISCHDPAAAPNAGASTRGAAADVAALDPRQYFDLHYRPLPHAVVVASSGIPPADSAPWQVIPNHTMLVIDRATLHTRPVPLSSGLTPVRAPAPADPGRPVRRGA